MCNVREWVAMQKLRRATRYGSRCLKVRVKRVLHAPVSASEAWAHCQRVVRAHRRPLTPGYY